MSKKEDIKFLRMQTCVIKVSIHCDGCKKKVKKLLQKVDGVYTTSVDAERGRVTVSGDVDPATLIKKLSKAGKHAELLAPKNGNIIIDQGRKPQPRHGKAQPQDNGKQPKGGNGGGGGGGKDRKGQHPEPTRQLLQQLQQMKRAKDLQLPQLKDSKHRKSTFPPKGFDDYDDEDDLDDEMDEFDGFDADFDGDFENINIKPAVAASKGYAMSDKKGGGGSGAEKGEVPVQNKGMQGNGAGGGGRKGGGGGSATKQGWKNHGANNGNTTVNSNPSDGASKGHGKKEAGGGGGGHPMLNPGMMGNIPAAAAVVRGLPARAPQSGYYHQTMAPRQPPEVVATANPYQQQYMAAMMQKQQQQRMMMMMNAQDSVFQPAVGYARPPLPMYNVPPPPPPLLPHQSDPYTTFFSDENTSSSCSIM
ncbi:heavy metal-associated domain containing protein [Musa troglodytarum]|uniref:Heavy metal-associated domain containing protein n=1 Tax=Musa troglodytarum TaxID=320322 RepID=A0A9E7HBD5_9LILI|nr:heavy metal-associated domain containing protein [Musa troglodytarum]